VTLIAAAALAMQMPNAAIAAVRTASLNPRVRLLRADVQTVRPASASSRAAGVAAAVLFVVIVPSSDLAPSMWPVPALVDPDERRARVVLGPSAPPAVSDLTRNARRA